MLRNLLCIFLFVSAGLAAAHGESQGAKQAVANPSAADETAFGRAGDARKVTRTIRVQMSDRMRFSPALIDLRQNETVRFVVKNTGKLLHEMVLGRSEDLKAHAELMRKHLGMEHDEQHMAHVPPGKSRSIVWQFTQTGTFSYGCLVPGHFEAGMVGQIRVIAKGDRK
jgi:uncharacterized cupredoxin-like copper-binding protein